MKIFFKESGLSADLVAGKTILEYAHELEVEITAPCNGEGKCGQCLVEVESAPGALSPTTEVERKVIADEVHRLACQARVLRTAEPIYVRVPRRSYCVLESGRFWEIPVAPLVHREGDRVLYGTDDMGAYTGELYGIALDVGTTTLAMYLVDLETGRVLSVISQENPQTRYASNIISRIEFARTGREKLERELRIVINEMITALTAPEKVYELVVVGNTVMRDLFLGFSVEPLGRSPYEPLSDKAVYKAAHELGLMAHPKAAVYGLPLIGSFIGADALAMVLATNMYRSRKLAMAIDIGTNTEIVLGNQDRLIATSCAAGPAFEGCSVRFGIGGISGAIKEVRIVQGKARYKTIYNAPPIGICGSGLIDILAELLEHRLIDGRGKFYGTAKEFEIDGGITLSEADIDQLNLAKSAVSVGIKILLDRYGVALEDIDLIYLAGAFGYYINLRNAMRIGLLPTVKLSKVDKVGNAAIEGARQVLVSLSKREDAEALAARIEHIKLEEERDFIEQFVGELYFQQYL